MELIYFCVISTVDGRTDYSLSFIRLKTNNNDGINHSRFVPTLIKLYYYGCSNTYEVNQCVLWRRTAALIATICSRAMVDAVCWQPWRLSWRKKLYISLLDANFLVWYKQLRLSIVSYLFDVALKESCAELHHVTVIECRWSDTVFVQYLIVIHAELLAMSQLDTTQLCTRITLPISVGPTPDLYSVGVNVVKFARAFDIILF